MYLPSGLHVRDGMVAAAGAGVERLGRVDRSDIRQVAPSVLAVMGVSAPSLELDPFGFVSARFVSTGRGPTAGTATESDLNEDEEAEVLERLRGLGYVD